MFQAVVDFLKDYGPWGLFVHSFLDAVIFPIPAFYLQVTLSWANPASALWLATLGYIACLLGTPVGYLIGKLMGKAVLYKFLKRKWIDAATRQFQKNGEAAILIGAFTPIPFKVFTILSGCLNFPLWRLVAYAAIGRAVKFYAVGALFYFYGRAAESMVTDASFYLYIFLGGIPIVALILFISSRMKKKKAALQATNPDADGVETDREAVQQIAADSDNDAPAETEAADVDKKDVETEVETKTEEDKRIRTLADKPSTNLDM